MTTVSFKESEVGIVVGRGREGDRYGGEESVYTYRRGGAAAGPTMMGASTTHTEAAAEEEAAATATAADAYHLPYVTYGTSHHPLWKSSNSFLSGGPPRRPAPSSSSFAVTSTLPSLLPGTPAAAAQVVAAAPVPHPPPHHSQLSSHPPTTRGSRSAIPPPLWRRSGSAYSDRSRSGSASRFGRGSAPVASPTESSHYSFDPFVPKPVIWKRPSRKWC